MYAHKLAAGSRDCSRVPNIVEKLIIYLVCLCTGLAPSLAFAIDPYVPGFTLPAAAEGSAAANAARAASAAGGSLAGLGAAAAALGAFGLGFCAASYAMGTGACTPNSPLGLGMGAASGGAIAQNPDSGDLEKIVPPRGPCERFYGVGSNNPPAPYVCVDVPHASLANWQCAQRRRTDIVQISNVACYQDELPTKRRPTPEELGDALGGDKASPKTKAAAAAAAGAAAHSLASGGSQRQAAAAAAAAAATAKPTDSVCTVGKHLNPQNGACSALAGDTAPAEPVTCAAPMILNPTTNGCSLPDSKTCAAGAVYDFVSKKCLAVDNTVKENNGTGVPSKDFEIPSFCDWAKPVCTAIEWLTNEDIPAQTVTKVDVKPQASPVPDSQLENSPFLVSWGRYCPPDIPINFTLLKTQSSFSFKYQPICEFMEKLRPLVIAAAYLSGAYIIGGIGRGQNDG